MCVCMCVSHKVTLFVPERRRAGEGRIPRGRYAEAGVDPVFLSLPSSLFKPSALSAALGVARYLLSVCGH